MAFCYAIHLISHFTQQFAKKKKKHEILLYLQIRRSITLFGFPVNANNQVIVLTEIYTAIAHQNEK